MMDLKKLITGFLILAALSSYVALIFSGSGSERYTAVGVDYQTQEDSRVEGVAEINQNAFVESLPADPYSSSGSEDENLEVAVLPSSNLTENLARRLALEMVAKNPEGPTETEAGLSLPVFDEASLYKVAYLGTDNLDFIKTIPEDELKAVSGDSREDFLKYLNSINALLGETEIALGSKKLAAPNVAPEEVIRAVQVTLEKAAIDVREVPAPKDLVGFHANLTTLIKNQELVFSAINDYRGDPLKALVALSGAEKVVNRDLANLQAEVAKLTSTQKISGGERASLISFVSGLFKIQRAFAILPPNPLSVPVDCQGTHCFDQEVTKVSANATKIVLSLKELVRMIWEALRRFATEELKNRLVQMLTQNTVKWIQGGGKRKFVENWGEFFGEAVDRAAGATIQKEIPQLCSSFGPLVRVALLPKPYVPSSGGRCTLRLVVNQLTRLYERFEEGDWVTYSNALKPHGNIWGSIVETHDKVVLDALAAKEAAQNKAQAAQGFSEKDSSQTTKVCGAPQPHNLSELSEIVGPLPPGVGVGDKDADAGYLAFRAGEDLDMGAGIAGDGDFFTCPVGAWKDTTPGSAIGHTLYTALDAPLQRIVNAQDLVGLISALVDSALNRLIRSAADGLNSLFEKEPFTRDSNGDGVNDSYYLDDLCKGLSGPALTDCLNKSGESSNIEATTPSSPDETQEGRSAQACAGKQGQDYSDCIGSLQGVATSSPGGEIPPAGVNNPPTLIAFNGPATVQRLGGLFPDFWQIRANDSEGQMLTFTFDWGDGNTDTYTAPSSVFVSPAPTHIYTGSPGNYLIRVNISDGVNNITATLNVNVVF